MLTKDRERYLEKKVVTLEQRLVLLERFVEMRFCETFRDFSIRNLPASSLVVNDDIGNKKILPVGRSEARQVGVAVNPEPEEIIMDDGGHDDVDPAEGALTPDEEESATTYRTRSGRKSKRLTTTALGIRPDSTSFKVSKPLASSSTKVGETQVSKKVLRVKVKRLDARSNGAEENTRKTGTGADEMDITDTTIVKINYDTGDEEVGNADDDDGDNYFTFPNDQNDAEVTVEDENQDSGDKNSKIKMLDTEPPDSDNDDWDPSGVVDDDDDDDDYEEPGKKRKSIAQVVNPTPTPAPVKKRRIKKKYDTPSSVTLIPEGVQLQVINPDKTNLKECPYCHHHWKPELFDQHVSDKHLKERHLKCSFCDQRFFTRNARNTHQRLHQLDKYGKKCRLCEKLFLEKHKVLSHEQFCIRKHLEHDKHVDPAIMEDVRQRSKNVDLKWPGFGDPVPEGMKKCVHCNKLFASNLFKDHLKNMHAEWKCNFCDRTYVGKNGLVRHLCRSHGNNRITCELCQTVFESREEIRAHNEKCRQEHRRNLRKMARQNEQEETSSSSTVEKEVEVETSQDSSSAEIPLEPTTDENSAAGEVVEEKS